MLENDREILEKIENFALEHNMWGHHTTIICAVSGGSDSIFMLCALKELSEFHEFKLRALHINHLLRGRESEGDQMLVESICQDWEIPLDVYRLDIAKIAKDTKLGIEETARNQRRKIYNRVAEEYGGIVALGHTADDVVETFLFNLFRGTGIRGLAEMEPKTGIIIRPILQIWHNQARNILGKMNIPWRYDSSNRDLSFSRNKIRHKLLPFIRANFGEESITHIKSASAMIRMTKHALERYFRMHYDSAFIGKSGRIIAFHTKYALEDPFTFGELLRQALPQLDIGLKGFSRQRVDRLFDALLRTRPDSKISIYSGAFAVKFGNCLIITDHKPIQTISCPIAENDELQLSDELGKIETEVVSPPALEALLQHSSLEAFIDYRGQQIEIKPYHSNMYFKPLGGASIKLSSFLKSRRVPAIFRRALPFIFVDNKLAWVGGVEISEQVKITTNTKQALHIKWTGNFPEILVKSTEGTK
ncbi:tRNA lysidine(34) synthetase TilS [bacterium]|nr:MAG: tRNA lysidine(34) synthetase TilS [bacterium]